MRAKNAETNRDFEKKTRQTTTIVLTEVKETKIAKKVSNQACRKEEGRGGSCPSPDFGGSEGAAGQQRCAALLPAPRIFGRVIQRSSRLTREDFG